MRNLQPILIPIIGKESGDRWKLTGGYDGKQNLTGDWWYYFFIDGYEYKLKIPYGFEHIDGASVPRFIAPIVRMGGREMPDEAWLPHDFFYYHKGIMPQGSLFRRQDGQWKDVAKVSREFADRVFRNELKSSKHGLSSFKAPVAFIGVRMAFWKRWK